MTQRRKRSVQCYPFRSRLRGSLDTWNVTPESWRPYRSLEAEEHERDRAGSLGVVLLCVQNPGLNECAADAKTDLSRILKKEPYLARHDHGEVDRDGRVEARTARSAIGGRKVESLVLECTIFRDEFVKPVPWFVGVHGESNPAARGDELVGLTCRVAGRNGQAGCRFR